MKIKITGLLCLLVIAISAYAQADENSDNFAQELIQAADESQAIDHTKSLLERNLAHNIPIDWQNESGYTALHYAVLRKNVPLVQLLLEAGANPNKLNRFGFTPFMYSFDDTKNIAIVQLLLDHGANVNQRVGRSGSTPFIYLIGRGRPSPEVIMLLINAGANVNVQMDDGSTPLHEAAAYGNRQVAEILIANGADPMHKTNKGQTPADYARLRDHIDLANFLEQKISFSQEPL